MKPLAATINWASSQVGTGRLFTSAAREANVSLCVVLAMLFPSQGKVKLEG